uniref:Integrase catalytic domain-containing protein n=1 Tax=Trichuris muris TaxID=70415 RepID=A0A5S6QMK3_TRIMR
MNQMNIVSGLQVTGEQKFFCEGCVFGSMARRPHKEAIERRECLPGEIIHTDVCGPFIQPSIGGSMYFICFKDESSAYRKVYFMKRKDEVLRCLKTVLAEVRNETGHSVKRVRSDCGTEFINKSVSDFLVENGIIHEKSPPYTPQCNGMAERENRTLTEKGKVHVMCKKFTEISLGAVHTAAYLMNRVPNRKETATTPYEEWFGKRPSVSHLRVFGCDAYVRVPDQYRKKFDSKARKVTFVGYGRSNKIFRIYDPQKHQIYEVTDIKFRESLLNGRILLDEEEVNWTPLDHEAQMVPSANEIETDKKQASPKRGSGTPPENRNRERVTEPLTMELRPRPRNRAAMLVRAEPGSMEEALEQINGNKQ